MSKSINVLLAAATGFIAGILLAPKSGAETREELKTRARDTKERIDEKAGEAKKVMHDGADKIHGEVRGMAESVRGSANKIAGETNSLANEAKARADRASQNLK